MARVFITGLGQDSHRFVDTCSKREHGEVLKELKLGGVLVPGESGLHGNSDADVILHALCNGISGLTGKPVLGERSDILCKQGITDSQAYLEVALEDLHKDARGFKLHHVSISVEGARPKLMPLRAKIVKSLAGRLNLPEESIALTATTGEDLSAFGRGEGLFVTCLVSASYEDSHED